MSERDKTACLLLHGFSATPFEMEPLAEALERAGHAARAPLLPGHGESIEAFAGTGFADWYAAAEAAYLDLRSRHARVALVGLSMGGSLCLRLAQRHDPAGVLTLAAPVWLYRLLPWKMRDWRLPLVPVLRYIRPVWDMAPPSPASRAIAPWRGYEGTMALGPLASLMAGLRSVRRELHAVRAPLLALHAPGDRTVPVENALEIVRRVASSRRGLELLAITENVTGHHLLTTHRETRETVIRRALDFVRSLEASKAPDGTFPTPAA